MSDETSEAGAPGPTERPPSAPAGAATRRTAAKPTPRAAAPASGRPQLRSFRDSAGNAFWHCWEAGVTIEELPAEDGRAMSALYFCTGTRHIVYGTPRELAQQLGLDW